MTARTATARTTRTTAQRAQRELEDLQLVLKARNGSTDALDGLIRRYTGFVRLKASSYFLAGGDSDDLVQEGMIGLYKAVRDFRPDKETSFRSFAELCVTRQIITAIKTATRQKHQALNQYVSISGSRYGDESHERTVEELIHVNHHDTDPADRIVADERFGVMRDRLAEVLSDLEVDVLTLYVEGKSYQEIGDHLGRHVKSIDNALQRIKRKLEVHLSERAEADREEDLALIA